MKKTILFILTVLFFIGKSSALPASLKETIFNKEKGFFSCSGASNSALFKQDCLELTIDRISFGGDIVYEGTCLDSSGKNFRLSCGNFVFEPEAITSNTKKNYFDK